MLSDVFADPVPKDADAPPANLHKQLCVRASRTELIARLQRKGQVDG